MTGGRRVTSRRLKVDRRARVSEAGATLGQMVYFCVAKTLASDTGRLVRLSG